MTISLARTGVFATLMAFAIWPSLLLVGILPMIPALAYLPVSTLLAAFVAVLGTAWLVRRTRCTTDA